MFSLFSEVTFHPFCTAVGAASVDLVINSKSLNLDHMNTSPRLFVPDLASSSYLSPSSPRLSRDDFSSCSLWSPCSLSRLVCAHSPRFVPHLPFCINRISSSHKGDALVSARQADMDIPFLDDTTICWCHLAWPPTSLTTPPTTPRRSPLPGGVLFKCKFINPESTHFLTTPSPAFHTPDHHPSALLTPEPGS